MGNEPPKKTEPCLLTIADVCSLLNISRSEYYRLSASGRLYWGSNSTIAKKIGHSERYVEKLAERLAKKRWIRRGYAHKSHNGELRTVRVIIPLCFPEKYKCLINWISPEQTDGQQTEQQDGITPNNRTFLPEQQDDLLERNREKNKKATPSPLPASGQATALQDKRQEVELKIINIDYFYTSTSCG